MGRPETQAVIPPGDPWPIVTVYLAGPVSGRIDEAKVEFAQAEAELHSVGYLVVNPLKSANNPAAETETRRYGRGAAGMPQWQRVMRKCIRDLMHCDMIFMLPGWQDSEGACFEKQVAERVGMPVIYYESWLYAPAL